MNNIVFGVITIIICSSGYFFSWKYFSKDKFNSALFLLCICGLLLRFFFASDLYLHEWDERFHALVAKNFLKHPFVPALYDTAVLPYDYKNWSANHVWLHKQPFPLWSVAGSIWFLGANELAIRLPSILLTTIGIWLTFSIGSFFFDKKAGFLSAFFYSINGLILDLAGGRAATDHVDVFFFFFVELAVFFSILFAEKRNFMFNVLAGASIGLAILSKWLPALIVLPVWLLLVIHSKNFRFKTLLFHLFILVFTCALIVLPWNLYIRYAFPIEAAWEALLKIKHFTESIEGQDEPFYYYLNRIRRDYGELIYLPLAWFIWNLIRDSRNLKLWAIAIWVFIPIFFFSMAVTKMGAYILISSPPLFIISAGFWCFLLDYKKGKKHQWVYNIALFLLIALPIRYTIERMKPFENTNRKPEWVDDLKKLNARKIEKGVLLNYKRPIEAMFYTDLVVYPDLPDKKIILALQQKGYSILINDDHKLTPEISSMNGVELVSIRGAR